MGNIKWTYRETERLKYLAARGFTASQITIQINAEFKRERTVRGIERKMFEVNKYANLTLGETYKEKRCLCCRRAFFTDQPRQIHICDGCKGSETFHGAA